MYPHDAFLWSPLRSLRVGPYQYIDAPKAELYALGKDPAEQHNAIQTDPSEARQLRGRLRTLLASNSVHAGAVRSDTSEATVSSLGSLGYIAAGSRGTVATGGPDPKDRLAEYQQYEHGLAALYDHREAEAVTIFETILKRDDALTIARYYLGEAYLRLGRKGDALRTWKSALARDPGYQSAAEAIQKLESQPGSR
jgi:tetratricopeptide (TPR) repeat protein